MKRGRDIERRRFSNGVDLAWGKMDGNLERGCGSQDAAEENLTRHSPCPSLRPPHPFPESPASLHACRGTSFLSSRQQQLFINSETHILPARQRAEFHAIVVTIRSKKICQNERERERERSRGRKDSPWGAIETFQSFLVFLAPVKNICRRYPEHFLRGLNETKEKSRLLH